MHIRCPHCHNPIEVVGDDLAGEILCSSCGSSFSLISGETTHSHLPDNKRTIAHFELIEELGVGHFGSVWKARDTELDRLVAVKLPRKDQLDPAESAMFLREARAAAQLKHPSIVAVHEVGRDQDAIYIISDYVAGANLKEWLTAQRLTPREAAELVAEIAEGLEHAHQLGVIHRDLKPSNILMDLDGRPHIADFGLAKRETGEITMTVEGRILGTPAYMSPEQARGEGHQADRRSDIYSLGVILFELLTGELPFRGDQRMLLVQIQRDEPPRLRKMDAKVPRDLETITLKCLEKQPGRRYQTAAALAEDLKCWLGCRAVTARPVTNVERGWRWCRRNPLVAGLAAAVAIALISGTLISNYFAVQATASASKAIAERERAEASAARAREERNVARRLLYRADMNLAQSAWEINNVNLVRDLLAKHDAKVPDEDLRGWEWYYLLRLCESELRTLNGHTSIVSSVMFSPDGRRLASTSYDRTTKVWDAETGAELHSLKSSANAPLRMTFSPDGRQLASTSIKLVEVWNSETGTLTSTFECDADQLAFSPDGKQLVTASRELTIQVWDAQTGVEVRMFKCQGAPARSLALSSNGKLLASVFDDDIHVWDMETGTEHLTLKGHHGPVVSLAFSSDTRRIASADGNQTMKLWDAESGAELHTLNGKGNCLTFSPDGKKLVSGGNDGAIKVWDAERGVELHTLRGHKDQVNGVAFNPDGRRLASAGGDKTVKIWDSEADPDLRTITSDGFEIPRVVFSPDLRHFASFSQPGSIKVQNTESGAVLWSLKDDAICAAFSLDGKQLATACDEIKVWDARTGAAVGILESRGSPVQSLAFGPDGHRLVSGDQKGKVCQWDLKSGVNIHHLEGHTDIVRDVTYSPDGRRLASASDDETIKLWDSGSGAELRTLIGHTYGVASVVFSPDGQRLASASGDETVKLWDSESGAELRTLKGHTGYVFHVAFTPDGRRLASAAWDETIKVWDTDTGAELCSLKGHRNEVSSLAFSPDGRRLASASSDLSIKVRDTALLSPDEKSAHFYARQLIEQQLAIDEALVEIAERTHWSNAMRDAAVKFIKASAPATH